MTTLVLALKKIENEDETNYETFYSNSKAKVIIIESNRDGVFESIYTTIISNVQKSFGKFSGLIIDSIIRHNIGISK